MLFFSSCVSSSPSYAERNAKYQKSLKEMSTVRNFNFNIDFDLDEPRIESNQHQMLLSKPTHHQVNNINQSSNASSMNKLFCMFGNNPIFNNSTFNMGN